MAPGAKVRDVTGTEDAVRLGSVVFGDAVRLTGAMTLPARDTKSSMPFLLRLQAHSEMTIGARLIAGLSA